MGRGCLAAGWSGEWRADRLLLSRVGNRRQRYRRTADNRLAAYCVCGSYPLGKCLRHVWLKRHIAGGRDLLVGGVVDRLARCRPLTFVSNGFAIARQKTNHPSLASPSTHFPRPLVRAATLSRASQDSARCTTGCTSNTENAYEATGDDEGGAPPSGQLARLIEAWPSLPEATRAQIVALLDVAAPLDADCKLEASR